MMPRKGADGDVGFFDRLFDPLRPMHCAVCGKPLVRWLLTEWERFDGKGRRVEERTRRVVACPDAAEDQSWSLGQRWRYQHSELRMDSRTGKAYNRHANSKRLNIFTRSIEHRELTWERLPERRMGN